MLCLHNQRPFPIDLVHSGCSMLRCPRYRPICLDATGRPPIYPARFVTLGANQRDLPIAMIQGA